MPFYYGDYGRQQQYTPYFNPPLPFSCAVPNGSLSTGQVIVVTGSAFPGADRFALNLKGWEPDECFFHFNPRFGEGEVVRNTNDGSGWGDEERAGGMPFYDGRPFEIEFHAREDGFYIVVDKRHFCFYGHRVPLDLIHLFNIEGDCEIHSIEFKKEEGSLTWEAASGGSVPAFGEPVQGGSTSDGEPLYVGRTWCDGDLLVGKVHPSHGCLYVPQEGEERRYDEYEVLVGQGGLGRIGIQWNKASAGSIPNRAVVGGYSQDGEPLYVGRAFHEGDLLPGKVCGSHGCCYVPWGSSEHREEEYEVLTDNTSVGASYSGTNRIDFPACPFQSPLPAGSVAPGMIVQLRGTPHPGGDRFEFDFLGHDMDEYAVHFNPRFGEGEVVRNSKHEGSWGDEERDGGFPFQDGVPFDITISVDPDAFYISVNGRHFCRYGHRFRMDDIGYFQVSGDVQIEYVDFQAPQFMPFIDDRTKVTSPESPYYALIPHGYAHPGTTAVVRAIYHGDGGRFDINFLGGIHSGSSTSSSEDEEPESTYALHFNPRFDEGEVIRNHMEGGDWGSEERDGGFPFMLGEPFEVAITVNEDAFRINVNGQYFADFAHRMSIKQARRFSVTGSELEIYSVEFREPIPAYSPQVYSPALPYDHHIPGGLYPGRIFVIEGTPREGERFSINLLRNEDNIALHFDVRFNYGGDEQVIVRNSLVKGEWGGEERDVPYFPFEINRPFQVKIKADYDKFLIAVNGVHFLEFAHRIFPITRVKSISIDGDVDVALVHSP